MGFVPTDDGQVPSSIAKIALLAASDQGRCGPTNAQTSPLRRYFAHVVTSGGMLDRFVVDIQLLSLPVGPFGLPGSIVFGEL